MSSNSDIEAILQKYGFWIFTGNGNSMWPLIREGQDTVEVRPLTGPPASGDVVLFPAGDIYILHRVLKIKGDVIIARGDNNISCETVPAERVIGVMTGLWKGEKKVPLESLSYRIYTFLCLHCPRLFRVLRSLSWR